jgi:glycerophosphoryl diester phosphodiesterase
MAARRPVRILAHRGNVDGPEPARENGLALVQKALERGFGIETDVRYAAGKGFYISHDPAAPSADSALAAHCGLWRRHPEAVIALNVKELGKERALLEALNALRVVPQLFLFDMELIEKQAGETARLYRRFDAAVTIAARVSDRDEPLERALAIEVASVAWLDEFDGPWATADAVGRLKAAGKAVYAVSPELHGRPIEAAEMRWRDFAAWGVDGICTDWPARLAARLAGRVVDNGRP